MHILAASLNACVHEHLREGLLLLVEAPVLLPNRLLELLIGTRQVPRQRVGGDARPRGVVSPHEKLERPLVLRLVGPRERRLLLAVDVSLLAPCLVVPVLLPVVVGVLPVGPSLWVYFPSTEIASFKRASSIALRCRFDAFQRRARFRSPTGGSASPVNVVNHWSWCERHASVSPAKSGSSRGSPAAADRSNSSGSKTRLTMWRARRRDGRYLNSWAAFFVV